MYRLLLFLRAASNSAASPVKVTPDAVALLLTGLALSVLRMPNGRIVRSATAEAEPSLATSGPCIWFQPYFASSKRFHVFPSFAGVSWASMYAVLRT